MPLMVVVVSSASTGTGVEAGPLTEVTARDAVGLRSAGPSAYAAQRTQAREHQTKALIRMVTSGKMSASTVAPAFAARRMRIQPQLAGTFALLKSCETPMATPMLWTAGSRDSTLHADLNEAARAADAHAYS